MLLDSNTILFEKAALSSAITGTAVPLTSLSDPGQEDSIPVYISVNETGVGGTGITLTLKECDTETGTFSTVESLTIPVADLVAGKRIAWRWLPSLVHKPWIRIDCAASSGTFTAGKISAAVVREDILNYKAGMYIDKGRVVPVVENPWVSMACGTVHVTSGTATALGSTACVLNSNDSTGTYNLTLHASAGSLSSSTITAQTVAAINTAIQTITINTSTDCTISCACYDSNNVLMSSGIVHITV